MFMLVKISLEPSVSPHYTIRLSNVDRLFEYAEIPSTYLRRYLEMLVEMDANDRIRKWENFFMNAVKKKKKKKKKVNKQPAVVVCTSACVCNLFTLRQTIRALNGD